MLEGEQGFSKWVHGLKIVMMMYDVDCAVDQYTYWSVIEGDLESWDEDALKGYGLKLKTWNRMNRFILQTMRLNCEEGPLRLIGVMNPPLSVPELLMLLLVAYLSWSLELD